jgi:hypothetical protein
MLFNKTLPFTSPRQLIQAEYTPLHIYSFIQSIFTPSVLSDIGWGLLANATLSVALFKYYHSIVPKKYSVEYLPSLDLHIFWARGIPGLYIFRGPGARQASSIIYVFNANPYAPGTHFEWFLGRTYLKRVLWKHMD